MARLSRIVIPDVPHHVTQRGNRRLPVFFSDEDRADSTECLEAIEARLRTGRPLASPGWISAMEQRIQRPLAPAKRGPKPKRSLV